MQAILNTTSLSAGGNTQSSVGSDHNDSPKSTVTSGLQKFASATSGTFDALFDRSSSSQQIVLSGHRGGQKDLFPENTMHAFEAAYEQQLSSIEFDVWLTKDDQLVIIHGGKNGELPEVKDADGAQPTTYIFDHTLQELQEHHKKTSYFQDAPSMRDSKSVLPTLEQLFDYASSSTLKMLLLVEIKSPENLEVRKKYNLTRCLVKLHELIFAKQVQDQCLMQSFDHDSVREFIEINRASGLSRIRTMNLESWLFDTPIITDLDDMQVDGIHVQFNPNIITKELVDKLHLNNKIISVWMQSNSEFYTENEQFYQSLASIGVDMICTDFPFEAAKVTGPVKSPKLPCESSFPIS